MNNSAALRQALCDFRTALHRCFGRRADALFEVSDALLTAGPLPSPTHLSLEPVHLPGRRSRTPAGCGGFVSARMRYRFVAGTRQRGK